MITGFTEDEQYFEAIKSMKEYISVDKFSELKNDEEFLLNKKSSDAFIFEVVTTQEEFLMKEEDEIQFEELICEATVETAKLCDLQIENLCNNVEIVSDDKEFKECQKEIALLEYLLEKSECDREIVEDRVHYSGQE